MAFYKSLKIKEKRKNNASKTQCAICDVIRADWH